MMTFASDDGSIREHLGQLGQLRLETLYVFDKKNGGGGYFGVRERV